MNVTTTPVRLGSSGYLIQNLGPDPLYVGEDDVTEVNSVKLVSGTAVTVGETSYDLYLLSEGTSEVYTLGEVLGFYAPVSAESIDLSAYVTKTLYDANTMLVAHTDNTPVAVPISTNQVLGRGNSGNVKGLTPAETVTIIGTEVFTQPQAVNAQTGTTYTLVLTDAGKLITLSNAAAITVTLPQDSAVAIAVGSYVDFYQLGAGQITLVAGTGATMQISGLTAKSRAQYSRFAVQKVSANTWVVFGDLAAS